MIASQPNKIEFEMRRNVKKKKNKKKMHSTCSSVQSDLDRLSLYCLLNNMFAYFRNCCQLGNVLVRLCAG